jgi:hypothetical protein
MMNIVPPATAGTSPSHAAIRRKQDPGSIPRYVPISQRQDRSAIHSSPRLRRRSTAPFGWPVSNAAAPLLFAFRFSLHIALSLCRFTYGLALPVLIAAVLAQEQTLHLLLTVHLGASAAAATYWFVPAAACVVAAAPALLRRRWRTTDSTHHQTDKPTPATTSFVSLRLTLAISLFSCVLPTPHDIVSVQPHAAAPVRADYYRYGSEANDAARGSNGRLPARTVHEARLVRPEDPRSAAVRSRAHRRNRHLASDLRAVRPSATCCLVQINARVGRSAGRLRCRSGERPAIDFEGYAACRLGSAGGRRDGIHRRDRPAKSTELTIRPLQRADARQLLAMEYTLAKECLYTLRAPLEDKFFVQEASQRILELKDNDAMPDAFRGNTLLGDVATPGVMFCPRTTARVRLVVLSTKSLSQ